MKTVGMWAKPETADKAVACSVQTDVDHVSTSPNPVYSDHQVPHHSCKLTSSQNQSIPIPYSCDSAATSQILSSPMISSISCSNQTTCCSQEYVPDETSYETDESLASSIEDDACWYLVSKQCLLELMNRCLQCGELAHVVQLRP